MEASCVPMGGQDRQIMSSQFDAGTILFNTSVEHTKSHIYRHGHSHQVYCWSLVWSFLAFGMPLRPWHWQRRAKISSMRLEWSGCLCCWRCSGVSPLQLRQRLWIDSSQKKGQDTSGLGLQLQTNSWQNDGTLMIHGQCMESIVFYSTSIVRLCVLQVLQSMQSAEVLLATLRFLVLGDGDGAGVIIGLYNNDEASHRKKPRCWWKCWWNWTTV